MSVVPAFAVRVHGPEACRPVVHVRGEIDLDTAAEMADALAIVVARRPPELVLDLTEVSFMDCSGVGIIVRTRSHLPDGARLVLRGLQPLVRRVLGILHVDALCTVED